MQRRGKYRGPRWLGISAWTIRHWRTVLVGTVAAIGLLGIALFALGIAVSPRSGGGFLMFVGVVLAGGALLRLPATIRLARRRPPTRTPQRRPRKAA